MTLLEELIGLRDRLNAEIKCLSEDTKQLGDLENRFDRKEHPVWIKLDLSVRASKGLCRLGIVTIDQIYEAHKYRRLYPGCTKNFGEVCIREISTKLVNMGLKPIMVEEKMSCQEGKHDA